MKYLCMDAWERGASCFFTIPCRQALEKKELAVGRSWRPVSKETMGLTGGKTASEPNFPK